MEWDRIPTDPCSVNCDRAITYLGFFRGPEPGTGPTVGDFLGAPLQGWENVAAHVRQVFGRMGFRDREAEFQRGEDGGESSSVVGGVVTPYSPKKHMKRYKDSDISFRIFQGTCTTSYL